MTNPFASLAELQAEHAALVNAVRKDKFAPANPERIRLFVHRGIATGAVLDVTADRAAAQSLINFWLARLSSGAHAKAREASSRPSPTATQGAKDTDSRPEFDDTLLAEFDPRTIEAAYRAADRLLEGLTDYQTRKIARRIVLRLARVAPGSQVFEPVPTSRAAVREVASSPEAVDAMIGRLADAGVIRVTKGETGEADQVALRDRRLLDEWPTYARWLRERVEEANRTMKQLRLAERAERYASGVSAARKASLLSKGEVIVAERWRDAPEVRDSGLVAPEVHDLINGSRMHWDQDEKRKLVLHRNILIGLGIVQGILLGVVLYFERKEKAATTEAKATARLTEELMNAHELRHAVVDAAALLETDPRKYIGLAREVYRTAARRKQDNAGQTESTAELQKLRDQLDGVYTFTCFQALDCLNLSLQNDRTEQILRGKGPAKKYEVNGVAFDPRGEILAAACSDGKVRLWRVGGGGWKALKDLEVPGGDKKEVGAVAFGGPDGGWLAAGGEAGVFVWFAAPEGESTPKEVTDPMGKGNWNSVAWGTSPGGWLLAASADFDKGDELPREGALQSWAIRDKDRPPEARPLRDDKGKPFRDEILAVTISPGGRLIAARRSDAALLTWTWQGGAWTAGPALAGPRAGKRGANLAEEKVRGTWSCLSVGHLPKYDRPGRADDKDDYHEVLLAGADNGDTAIWHLAAGNAKAADKLLLVIRHPCPVRGVALRSDGRMLATAGRDAKVRQWRLSRPHLQGLRAAIAGADGEGSSAEWTGGDPEYVKLVGHTKKVTGLTFATNADDRTTLASSSDDGTVRLWGPNPGPAYISGLSDLSHFAFSPDLEHLAGCDREQIDPSRRPWQQDLGGARKLARFLDPRRLTGPNDFVRRVAYRPGGGWATLNRQGRFQLWSEDGRMTEPASPPKNDEKSILMPVYGHIVFSRSGQLVAFSISKNELWVYKIHEDGRLEEVLAVKEKDLAKWSRGVKNEIDEEKGLSVYGFDLDERHGRLALGCSNGYLFVVDFSGPGPRLIERVTVSKTSRPAINSVSFSKSGTYLAAGCADAWVRVVIVGKGEVKELRRQATTEETEAKPTEEERRQKDEEERVHTMEVKRVCFHPEREDEIASGGDDGLVCIWRKQAGVCTMPFRFETGSAIQALRYNEGGDRLGAATASGQVRVYWFDPEKLIEVANGRLGDAP
jgi:WD40 repeat protein